jgi:hypothetical protein
LNELRYRKCFQLRATKFAVPIKDFEATSLDTQASNKSNNNHNQQINQNELNYKIDEYFWLKNNTRIKDWITHVNSSTEINNPLDYWK